MTPLAGTPEQRHAHHHGHSHATPAPLSAAHAFGHSPTTALVLGAGPRLAVAALASALLWLVVMWALS